LFINQNQNIALEILQNLKVKSISSKYGITNLKYNLKPHNEGFLILWKEDELQAYFPNWAIL
jgi:hypothetical protein